MLEKAIHTCRAMEAAKMELRPRQGTYTLATEASLSEFVIAVNLDCTSSDSLCAISRYKQSKGKRQSTPVSHSGSCCGCGQAKHPDGHRASCPEFKSVCSNCGKFGHMLFAFKDPSLAVDLLDMTRDSLHTPISSVFLVLGKWVLQEYAYPALCPSITGTRLPPLQFTLRL